MEVIKAIRRINYLMTETDTVYHKASQRIGVPDSVMRLLYTIRDNGDSCLLTRLYKQSGISKQTANSAINKLEKEGYITVEPGGGRGRMVRFTERGLRYAANTADKLIEIECEVLKGFEPNEIEEHIRLLEKYMRGLKERAEDIK